jgi:hypothetical protein
MLRQIDGCGAQGNETTRTDKHGAKEGAAKSATRSRSGLGSPPHCVNQSAADGCHRGENVSRRVTGSVACDEQEIGRNQTRRCSPRFYCRARSGKSATGQEQLNGSFLETGHPAAPSSALGRNRFMPFIHASR